MMMYIREELLVMRAAVVYWPTYVLFFVLAGSGIFFGLPLIFSVIAAAVLAVLCVTDAKEFILPDLLTLPSIVLGVLLAPHILDVSQKASLWGAGIGAGVFALLAVFFFFVRKKHGMGMGDIKLLALIGAWAGVKMLLPTLLIASFTALAFLPLRRRIKGIHLNAEVPFGPFLILGGWLSLLFGDLFWMFLLKGTL